MQLRLAGDAREPEKRLVLGDGALLGAGRARGEHVQVHHSLRSLHPRARDAEHVLDHRHLGAALADCGDVLEYLDRRGVVPVVEDVLEHKHVAPRELGGQRLAEKVAAQAARARAEMRGAKGGRRARGHRGPVEDDASGVGVVLQQHAQRAALRPANVADGAVWREGVGREDGGGGRGGEGGHRAVELLFERGACRDVVPEALPVRHLKRGAAFAQRLAATQRSP
mmetsp:Transcript_20574/g.47461  ORF Transcript_20574/g.47461 Transcript_20574/m.47461 type:complete len:225 (+) Transcript_20574:297-971(+)